VAKQPELVMIAGPNGSGKSTLIGGLQASPELRLPALYINADDIQREEGVDAHQAQQLAQHRRVTALEARKDVMYETVMSHPSKIAELQAAQRAGYHITIHFVATDDPEINVERVGLRVDAGGHDVPDDRIRARYARTLALAPVAIGYADQALIFDNTARGASNDGLQLQVAIDDGRIASSVRNTAKWVQELTDQYQERAQELGKIASKHPDETFLANLNSATQGPIVGLGRHYAVQLDEQTRHYILHDKVLLGAERFSTLKTSEVYNMQYKEGVASAERTSSREPPDHTR